MAKRNGFESARGAGSGTKYPSFVSNTITPGKKLTKRLTQLHSGVRPTRNSFLTEGVNQTSEVEPSEVTGDNFLAKSMMASEYDMAYKPQGNDGLFRSEIDFMEKIQMSNKLNQRFEQRADNVSQSSRMPSFRSSNRVSDIPLRIKRPFFSSNGKANDNNTSGGSFCVLESQSQD